MLIAAASDLHMTVQDRRDDFAPRYKAFMAATMKLPLMVTPVLLGDVIDVQGAEGAIARPAEVYKPFWDWVAMHHGIYIVGNHDEALRSWEAQQYLPVGISFCDRMIMDSLYWTHGHEWDLACSRYKSLGAAAMKLANLVGKDNPSLEDFFRRRQKTGRHSHPDEYEKQAQDFVDCIRLGIGPTCQGVVCGHSHRLEHVEYHRPFSADPTRIYINTGSVAFGDGEAWTLIKDGKFVGVVRM